MLFLTYCTSVAVLIWFKVFLVVLAIWQTPIAPFFSHQTICGCPYSTGLGINKQIALFRLLLGFEIFNACDM